MRLFDIVVFFCFSFFLWIAFPLCFSLSLSLLVADGYFRACGRIDDTINIGGVKISSVQLERVCNTVEGVRETAAVSVRPPGGGPDRLVLYLVSDHKRELPVIERGMQQAIKDCVNPLFRIHRVVPVVALPRTASNKVMRRVLRSWYMQSELLDSKEVKQVREGQRVLTWVN